MLTVTSRTKLNWVYCAAFSALLIAPSFAFESSKTTLSRSELQQKFQGFWLGQNIANWTGLITEMDKVGSEETLPFYTDADWGKADQKAMWGEFVPHASTIDFYLGEPNQPWGADDDTDIEYLYLQLHYQLNVPVLTAEQIRQGWLTHTYSETDAPLFKKFADSIAIKENFLWESNQRARELMQQGVLPPQTSSPTLNDKYTMIDAQLTTEIFGLFAPGRPDLALKAAELPIRTTAYADAADIARFYVVMHALAAVLPPTANLKEASQQLAQQARQCLPAHGFAAKMYDFVWQAYANNPDKNDWETTRDAVYQRYQLQQHDGYVYQQPFDAGINFAASLISWFYGEGDFKRTLQIGTLAGWDSDNPTATWGGLLGFMLGIEQLEKLFTPQRFSHDYWIHRTRRGFADRIPDKPGENNFSMMAEQMTDVAQTVLALDRNNKVDADIWSIEPTTTCNVITEVQQP